MQVNKCRKLGANVVLHGAHIGEAKDHALAGNFQTFPNWSIFVWQAAINLAMRGNFPPRPNLDSAMIPSVILA
jgi:hypothetical protein